jgi:hypothetical protein
MVGHDFAKRGAGMRNRFHALCPYYAMFPEEFAERWIDKLTRRNDVVLDVFSGRGTTPFQALLMERQAVAVDVSPVAYCITKAKTNAPSLELLMARLGRLMASYVRAPRGIESPSLPNFFRYAYKAETLRQLLFFRRNLNWRTSNVDCMIATLILSALHGEMDRSENYLSNQMPHAISTKPKYSVKYWRANKLSAPERDVFSVIGGLAMYRYSSPLPEGNAHVMLDDMRALPSRTLIATQKPRLTITSPPYFDVTNFEEDQWLRNWFLGGPPHPTYSRLTADNRHSSADNYWTLIGDMWRVLGEVMTSRAHVVMRFGAIGANVERMISQLEGSAVFSGRRVTVADTEVSEIRRRQTDTFRPGSTGCRVEVDCHFVLDTRRRSLPVS